MRKICLVTLLAVLLSVGKNASAQDFSNKGKEFWLAYCYHVGMLGGGFPSMTVYITSDVNTTYNLEIFGVATLSSGNITAGQVIPVAIPSTYFINDEGIFNNRTIRITSAKPVVVYSYITRNAASAGTLCLPTSVLGKEYYSMNFTQVSNENNSNSYFTIIAVEDNTAVEVTPSTNTKNGWIANNTYTVNLNKGQVYQVLASTVGFNGGDLTGSKIKSVASAGGGCKKIAVYSGSGKIRIPATGCSSNSSDNLYQQLYPTGSWGKRYLTVPSINNPNNYYRVAKSDPNANVYVNGALIPASSFINNYYQFFGNTPNLIESDLPISVAQYFTTQGCDGNSNAQPNDPDMIMLNPVEQNIDRVTLVSSNLVAASTSQYPHQHHIHAIMHNGGTGISSFRLDGNPVPASSWIVHPLDPTYSYLYMSNVAQGYHTLSSDSGFNATAYGYANAESYGYSAGANVKDLYQFISVSNQFASVDFPAGCKGAASSFSMTFPYKPTEIVWQFNGLFPDVTLTGPSYNSSSVVNGRTLYKYDLPGTYTMPGAGSYPIKVIAQNPTSDGCNGVQEIDMELQVFDPPSAGFNFLTNGCVSSPVSFTDNSTNSTGRPINHWFWSFGDNATANDLSSTTHTYAGPGSYTVKYTVMSDIGCKADTVQQTVVLNDPPTAAFAPVAPYCAGKTIAFNDNSSVSTGSIAKWHWNFGDGPTTTFTTGPQSHTYAATGTYTVTLQVETASGCLSNTSSTTINVNPNPVVAFNLPSVCLPAGAAQFNSTSTIADGSESQFSYAWNFGDASPIGGGQNPLHNYASAGPFDVSLTVTSNNGCVSSLTQNLATVYAEPKAIFAQPAAVCLGTATVFTDQSTAPGSSITQWAWDFGDATSSTLQNPTKTYTNPGTYTVTLKVTSAVGCQSVSTANIATRQVVVNALPVADFTTTIPGCAGQGVTFTNTSSTANGAITKWTWNFGDANSLVLTSGAPFIHTYSNASPSPYPATLQVETDLGCVSTVTTRPVLINARPVAAFTSTEICVNDVNAPLTDASTGGAVAWNWNFGDVNANGGNPNTSTQQNPTHHFTVAGNYNVQLVATNAAGCRDTIMGLVTVNGGVLTPQFSIVNTAPLCSNKEITIQDASGIDAGKIIKLEIYWDPANPGDKTTDNSPAAGKTYTHTYPEFFSPASKTYNVRYVVYSGASCVNEVNVPVTVLATPQLAFSAVLPVCSNVPAFQLTQVQLINNLPGAGVFSGNGVSGAGLFDPQAAGNGDHTITYTYTADNGCVNASNQLITVDPTPDADAGPDKFLLEGGFVNLSPVLITSIPVTYAWTPALYLNNANIASPQATPPTDFTYTLTVTSDKGCTDNDQVFVKLLKSLVIPNIFSPNGDGINDKWVIEHLDTYPGCEIQIFNRYGQLVQRYVNYSPWDGKIKGQDAPVGTYYYIIDPKNGRKPITGFVDIIR